MSVISKVHHHIRHTRPKWYRHYHQWEHHSTVHWVMFSMSTIVMLLGFVNAVMLMQRYNLTTAEAATGTTNITQTVNAGTLSLNSSATAALSAVTASVTSSQNSTGSLGTVTITDNRGSGVGWSATTTSTDFYSINAPVTTSGAHSLTSGGTYSNSTGGTYTVTITTGGTPPTAKFSVSGLETASNQTTGTGVAVGTRGVTATFAGATNFTLGDSWTIRVDTIPVTGFQFTPGSLTTIAGSSTNVTAGSVHTFSSTADPTTLITATTGGYGMGSYSVNPALQLTVPAATYANSYVATVTETVN